MPAPSHPASDPNQDSDADGDGENDQRAVLDLAGHPVQCIVAELGAELGRFVAETLGLVADQTPTAAKAIENFSHGRGDGVTEMPAPPRHLTFPYFDEYRIISRMSSIISMNIEMRKRCKVTGRVLVAAMCIGQLGKGPQCD
jgi:hypothetical protein